MKKSGFVFLGLAGIAAVYWFSRGATNIADSLRVRFSKIGFNFDETRKSLFTRLYFNATVNLVNPTNRDVNIQRVAVGVSYNNKPVGVVYRDNSVTVGKYASTDVSLLVGVSTLNIYRTISDAVSALTSQKPITFNVVGQVVGAGGVQLNFNQPYTIQL